MRSFLTVAAAGLLTAALAAAPSSGRVSESTGAHERAAGGAPSAAPLPNFQAQGGHLIRLLAGAFDPLSEAPPAPAGIVRRNEATLAAGQPQYWLVQVSDGRFAEASKAIGAAGAKVVGVVPDATYMVRATPAQRARLAQADAVRWTGFYQPAWRLPTANSGRKALTALQGVQTYRIYAFRDDPAPAAVGRALAGMPGVTVVDDAGAVVDVRATAAQLPAIAALPAVEWVDLKPEYKLLNANARWVTDTGVRDLYAATRVGRLTGAGQTAAVADTAVNYTNDRNGVAHVGFRDCPGGACKLADYTQAAPGNTPAAMDNVVANHTSHRKMAAFFDIGNTGPNPGDDASHGSHTAGSIAGDQGSNGIPDGHDGMAPGARLVDQNIGTAAGGLTIPSDLYDVFRQAYRPSNPSSVPETSTATGNVADYAKYIATEDARTHNNSWSSAIGGQVPNSALSVAVDKFVWDHEDMVIVFSAGNGGPGTNTFSAPSNAKNDISSGASANGRQPMASIDSMAIFSSHGPTQDGRFGPDVATPGQIVVSTKGGTSDGYHVLQGTSMSGPVLTGLATLVRQYFWDGYAAKDGDGFAAGAASPSRRHNPSAALVKATLVNGAVRMRGWYTGADGRAADTDGQWPSSGQGFGRVNLDNSLYFSGDPSNAWYQDVWRGDTAAFAGPSVLPATRSYTLNVQAGEPLDVTLSWTDAPNLLPAGTPALVNNLDLTVTGPAGTYVGNNMNSKLTPSAAVGETTPGPAPADVKEVTERVRIAAPAAGTYTVTVSASAIPTGNQGFALAASGRVSAVGQSFTPGPARQVDVAGNPTISNLRVEPVTSDTAIVRFTTNEPTTATATVGANTYVDSYNVGNDAPNVGGGGGFIGLNEGQVETSAEYANQPVLGTQHEVLLTGIPPGAPSIGVTATDVASNAASGAVPTATASGVFGADAPDIGQLLAGAAGTWKTGTQLYAGVSGTTTALGAFMFRVPESLDPATITGASVELTSAHDLISRYTQDPLLYVDLLDSGVEATWGTQTYEQIRAAAADARVFPETTHRRGGGSTYAFTFSCVQLQALKDTLSEIAVGGRKAAFRWDSTSTGLFSMEPGFNRRSNGPDRRPRLVLFTEGNANPYGRNCDPAAPAPTISGVGIHDGSTAGSVTVSWETNVESDSMVLVRKKSETSWTQVGTPALTKIHQVQLSGLDFSQDYVFVVRSAVCNGKATTDTNSGHGYGFFKTVTLGPGTQDAYFDFETGAEGWTATTTTTQDPDIEPNTTWALKPPGHESATAWNAEPYGDLDTAVLTSPPVALRGTVASVEFFVRHDFEQQPTPVFTTSDGLHVEYSADGGTTWNTIAFYQGQSPNYPAFQPKQSTTFATPGGGVLVRFKVVSDDNISYPPFMGAAVDRVRFVSYTPTGGSGGDSERPLSGPATPPSAGLTGLTAPPVRSGPATAADQAAGTGTCNVAGPATQPDLRVTGIVANNNNGTREGEKVTVTATVTNAGDAPAVASKAQFLDGTTVLGLADTPALAAGGSAAVSVFWDTREVKGEHTLRVTADQSGLVAESNEANNASTLTVTVKGNKVKNGSFEGPNAAGSGPDSWTGESTGAGTTSWSEGGSEGSKSVSTNGTGGNAGLTGSPSWTSAPIAVTPGEALDLVVSVNALGVSSAPTAGLAFVGAAGQILNTVKLITAPTLTLGFQKLEQSVTIPAGVMQARVVLTAFAPTDVRTAGTVGFDDVGLFAR